VSAGLAESIDQGARGVNRLHDATAVRQIEEGSLPGTARVSAGTERSDEELVAVRREVLNDAEHAVGNLLQRMHHAARAAKTSLGVQGERLQNALDDLEQLLDLLFDYVSPVEVQVRPLEADRVAESLAAQLRAQGVDSVTRAATPGLQVLADSRVLSRSFLLLAQAWGRPREGGEPVAIDIVQEGPGDDRVHFLVQENAAAVMLQAGLPQLWPVGSSSCRAAGSAAAAQCAYAVVLPAVA
jgi:hypothetical protein